ncbi:MAG: hypothetical protein IPI22_14785 [Bacteroidetes bacterium]|nr:hypothetical protein [Bacteroidota bacterium]
MQTDLDGNQQIVSKTIDLIWQAEGPLFNLYPNPTAQDLNIDIMATQSNLMQLWVIDLNGKKMKQISISVTPGTNHIYLFSNFPDLAKDLFLFRKGYTTSTIVIYRKTCDRIIVDAID